MILGLYAEHVTVDAGKILNMSNELEWLTVTLFYVTEIYNLT
jgi:hypothetical protein